MPAEPLAIPTDITAIQRGQHLASAVAACVECHGPNLAGKVYIDDPALGRIVPPNLTRGRGGVGRDVQQRRSRARHPATVSTRAVACC